MEGKTILLVDDEPDVVFTIKKILEKEGYTIIEAYNGKECIEKLKATRPDLILLDVMMPGVDGWSISKVIKGNESTKSIPIAMLTGLAKDVDKLTSFSLAQADWHISKPIDRVELVKTVKWLLEKSASKKPV